MYRYIVGLHPDEATEAIVDGALRHGRSFAVVPCCVFSKLFPLRRMPGPSGAAVTSYGDFLDYLQAKHPAIRRGKLPCGGANTVLWVPPGALVQ
jgi:hypothetical protein